MMTPSDSPASFHSFAELVERATGHSPYPYQQHLTDHGLPELLRVPTGAGKTLAATLPWLYRRRFHSDAAVREAMPRWLVYVLPMRVLVEQTFEVIGDWLRRLGLSEEVGLHLVMGGEPLESRWRDEPDSEAIFVGTLDMLLSRALNRGYGATRWAWPIDFGLFNNGCHFVFDEVQLMGPALPTSRQLEGLRRKIGTALPCSSTWMSATVEEEQLFTFDLPAIASSVELGDADRTGPLAVRLEAAKVVHRLEVDPDPKRYSRSLAEQLVQQHRAGTRTIAILNTVERAAEVRDHLVRSSDVPTVLVHSRFRPRDRAERVDEALADVEPGDPGRMVVSTQVLEAGVDISSTTLFTEAAPWPSIVQRAGRCNRDGNADEATLLWCEPPNALPYDPADVTSATEALGALEGNVASPAVLGLQRVKVMEVVHPVLRRRDLVELFDTTPDLSGNDIDVARFIRAGDDLDAQVAWRELGDEGPASVDGLPGRDERCPVPVPSLRKAVEGRDAWRYDHLDEAWVRCRPADVRPGGLVLLRCTEGGYDPELGWRPASKTLVQPVVAAPAFPLTETDTATGDDPVTFGHRWLSLRRHLEDVERETRALSESLAPPGLGPDHLEAAAVAGRLHDLGKVHPCFQDMLRRSSGETESELAEASACGPPWAKSRRTVRARNERRYFRHELASALALLDAGAVALDGVAESDLVVYLVAAHHGRVRLGFRSLPDEHPPPEDQDRAVALGVHDGETLPAADVPGGTVPDSTLDLSVMNLGDGANGQPSWSRRMLALRDRSDLGPFRMGFLEALVRLADWRASAPQRKNVT